MKKILNHSVCIFGLLLILSSITVVTGQNNEGPSIAKTRIDRLAGLAKLWGAAKYFHPNLGYREIDWDRAAIEAIPKVNAARSPEEYLSAIEQMLAALDDKGTTVRIPAKPVDTNAAETKKEIFELKNGTLTINVGAAASAIAAANNERGALLAKADQLLPQTKSVLVDLTFARIDEEISYYANDFLRSILTAMLDRDVALGSVRYRMHSGYATQTDGGAGFYYSAMTTTVPSAVRGKSKKMPTLVILVNQNSPSMEMVAGLHSAGLASVVQDGPHGAQANSLRRQLTLPDGVVVNMRVADLVNPDGSVGLSPDILARKGEGLRVAQQLIADGKPLAKRKTSAGEVLPLLNQKDRAYPEMQFPNSEYRLLALFRYWNVINYFYPYKDLIGGDWDAVLTKFIPLFEQNKDAADYQLTVRELVTTMKDSHGGVGNGGASAERLGTFFPPVITSFVEGRSVVVKILDQKSPLKLGDEILTVDGEPIQNRRAYLSKFIAASTEQALMRSVHTVLLRGQKDSMAKVKVRGADGKVRDVETTRSLPRTDPKIAAAYARTSSVYDVLPSGFGYVDLTRLNVGEVNKMFEKIKDTRGTIFDMRGYPRGTAWSIAPRLTAKKMPVAALFSRPIIEATNLSDFATADGASYSFVQSLPPAMGDVYTGKIVMLINEDAISQSEHTCLFFETARPDIVFIGTPTMGANGDVTFMVLPGNLTVSFTGHNVRHADGRQLQRVGIQPTIRVAPTIRGTVAGRDEILEAGIKYLQKNAKK